MYILNLKLKADLSKFTEQYMGLFIKYEKLQQQKKNDWSEYRAKQQRLEKGIDLSKKEL